MSNRSVILKDAKSILQTYQRFPSALVRGRGSWVWDADGKRKLDFLTGITVNMLGHAHPRILGAMKSQLQKISHIGNLFYNPLQAELAEILLEGSFASRVAFANTGAEANELCIKLARRHGAKQGRYEIITFKNSFHGRTYGALSATGQAKMHEGLGPMLPGFRYATYNDLKSVEKLLNAKTSAILVEPIQGEGGVHVGTPEFLKGLRALCDRKGLLLMVDEIQTGLGRCGRMYCYQHFGKAFLPDVMSLGKALGGGIPLSAVLLNPKAAALLGRGGHGTTMGGNPVACAGGVALVRELKEKAWIERAEQLGKELRASCRGLQEEFSIIREVRGRGLMLGLELTIDAKPLAAMAFEKGLIINATAERVLRLHPPLNVKDNELALAMDILRDCLKAFNKKTRKGN